MVKKISAYAASDGKLFTTALEAANWDARLLLKDLELFNEATIAAILRNPWGVINALKELQKHTPELAPELPLIEDTKTNEQS